MCAVQPGLLEQILWERTWKFRKANLLYLSSRKTINQLYITWVLVTQTTSPKSVSTSLTFYYLQQNCLICIYPASCPLHPQHLWSPQVVMLECTFLFTCTVPWFLLQAPNSNVPENNKFTFWISGHVKLISNITYSRNIIANNYTWLDADILELKAESCSLGPALLMPTLPLLAMESYRCLPCGKIPICHFLTFLFLNFVSKSNMEDENKSRLYNLNIPSITLP